MTDYAYGNPSLRRLNDENYIKEGQAIQQYMELYPNEAEANRLRANMQKALDEEHVQRRQKALDEYNQIWSAFKSGLITDMDVVGDALEAKQAWNSRRAPSVANDAEDVLRATGGLTLKQFAAQPYGTKAAY